MTTPIGTGLEQLTVGAGMHPGVLTCAPETPLFDVARTMARNRVHAVVVFAEIGEPDEVLGLWGVVSDIDLVDAVATRDVDGRTAGGSARTPVVTIAPHESVKRAAELMREHRVTHLIVVSPDSERPVGVISTLDVARALASEPAFVP